MLAIGAKEPRKNLPRLVDAFGLVQREQPDLALVLLGPDGPDQPRIDAAIARQPRSAAERILLVDYVSDEDRNAILHGAAALAYPSLDEGFGFPALEAMAAGVPGGGGRCRVAARGLRRGGRARRTLATQPPWRPRWHRVITDSAVRAELVALGREQTEQFSLARSAAGMDCALPRPGERGPVLGSSAR